MMQNEKLLPASPKREYFFYSHFVEMSKIYAHN